jgi:hypothetical protein
VEKIAPKEDSNLTFDSLSNSTSPIAAEDSMATRPPKPPERESAPRYRKRTKTGQDQSLSKARSLAQLTRSDVAEHEFDANTAELTGNSDRTTSIAATAMIERDLEGLILSHLGIKDGKLRDLLFERDGALSTFYGNIRFGRALGFYDKSFQDELDTIRRIRNAFAHSAAPITFFTEEIKKELNKMPTHHEVIKDTDFGATLSEEKQKFVTCCLVIQEKLLDIRSELLRDLETLYGPS